jgi:aarF domain-containing kinase
VSRRPLVSGGLAVAAGITTVAFTVENQTQRLTQRYDACGKNTSSQNGSTADGSQGQPLPSPVFEGYAVARVELPRHYDGDALRTYWSYRPITTVRRLGEIAYHLVPLLGMYIRDFELPKLTTMAVSSSSADKSAPAASNETRVLLQKKHAIAWRQALTLMGPAFVKTAQQVSIRPDLLPAAVLMELQQLCDAVSPVPDEIALAVLRTELNVENLDDVFSELPVLVASASLGQVYKARLHSPQLKKGSGKAKGMQVAVKVQRPDMLASFSLDLYLLKLIGATVDVVTSLLTKQPPFHTALYDSYAAGSYAELDYEHEAQNQLFFRHELITVRKCPVVIPDVVTQYSTRTVLVSEWIDGIRLSEAPVEQIQRLIPVGVELFLTQLLDVGRFHSDPHVGNLLLLKDSNKLCLLDFGLCTEISEQDRRSMTTAIWHLLQRDFSALVHHDTKALGFLPESFDTTELLPLLTKILTVGLLDNENGTMSMSNIRHRHRKLREISQELNEVFFTYPFSVPPFFALVTRGLGLLEGIALSGDENFDIFSAAAPYARRRAIQLLGRGEAFRRQSQRTPRTAAASN